MSEIQINQNFSNNSDDEIKINDEQINKEEKEMNEEELMKEIESTKQKLHKLYEQQWKLRMNKYKEFKKQQQQNDKKESEKAINQNKMRHGRFCHFYQQCSPFYNWYRYSQQQQPKLCEMTNDVSFKQKKKANERNKNHFCCKSRFHYSPNFWSIWSQKRQQQFNWCAHSKQNYCPYQNQYQIERCGGKCLNKCQRKHSPYFWWWIWSQKQQQQQQSKWCAHSKQNYCPYKNQSRYERCGGKCLNKCQRKHSPYFWWWIWSQKLKQRQMQQQSNYGSFEGRKCWKNPNFSNCIELKKKFCYNPYFTFWMFWTQKQKQMKENMFKCCGRNKFYGCCQIKKCHHEKQMKKQNEKFDDSNENDNKINTEEESSQQNNNNN